MWDVIAHMQRENQNLEGDCDGASANRSWLTSQQTLSSQSCGPGCSMGFLSCWL